MKKLLKKLTAAVLAATMIMAMGVTAFAVEPTEQSTKLADGTYYANVTLYKDANCSNTSMGNNGIVNPAKIVVSGDVASFTLYTKEFRYIGIKGALSDMTLEGQQSTIAPVDEIGDGAYDYIVSNLDATKMVEGSVLTGTFTVNVLGTHNANTGYLKINSISTTK